MEVTVVHELDKMKNNKNARIAKKARGAIRALQASLSQGETYIRGQTYEEVKFARKRAQGCILENNDDEILNCCLHFRSNLHAGTVILLTGNNQ